jgi:hypothetical protein
MQVMRRAMDIAYRTLTYIASMVAYIALAAVLGAFALSMIKRVAAKYATWSSQRFEKRSPIVHGLSPHGEWPDGEFKRRISETFPVGSSETELVNVLSTQCFRKKGRSMTLKRWTLFGETTWWVRWDADGDKLTSVNASIRLNYL